MMLTHAIRSVTYQAQDLVADGSTLTTAGSAPNAYRYHSCAATGTQGAFAQIQLPKDARAASPVSIVIWWASSSAESGTSVVWSVNALAAGVAGDLVGATGTTTQFTGTSAAKGGVGALVLEASTQILASANPGDLIRVSVRRLGDDAADNYTPVARLLAIELRYSADM